MLAQLGALPIKPPSGPDFIIPGTAWLYRGDNPTGSRTLNITELPRHALAAITDPFTARLKWLSSVPLLGNIELTIVTTLAL
jgi:hypothetical protein